MSEKPAASRRSITSFAADDDIPVPTAEQLAAAKSAGGAGLSPEKPLPHRRSGRRPRSGSRPLPTRCTSGAVEDRARFEDFVWRNRVSRGEAMTLLLGPDRRGAEGKSREVTTS
jgi:hypothetical protein